MPHDISLRMNTKLAALNASVVDSGGDTIVMLAKPNLIVGSDMSVGIYNSLPVSLLPYIL